MKLNTIHHIAVICSDKDAVLHFHHDFLGFSILRSNCQEGRGLENRLEDQQNDRTGTVYHEEPSDACDGARGIWSV